MILIFIFFLITLNILAQKDVKFYYSGLVTLKDSAWLKHYGPPNLTSLTVKLVFINSKNQKDSLYRDIYHLTKKNDSVFFEVLVPKTIIEKSDGVRIDPTYHFNCPGLIRGSYSVNADGKSTSENVMQLKLKSSPEGSIVYLIPKYIWETNSRVRAKNSTALAEYRIWSGITPVWASVQEYVYISLFQYKDQFLSIECSPVHTKQIDSVYVEFQRR